MWSLFPKLEHATASQSVRCELECIAFLSLCKLPRGWVENFLIKLCVNCILEVLLCGTPICDKLFSVNHSLWREGTCTAGVLARRGQLILGSFMVLQYTALKVLIQWLNAASEVIWILIFDIKPHDINLLISRISLTDHQIPIIIVIVFDCDSLGWLAFLNRCDRYRWFKLDVLYLEVFFTDRCLVERINAEATPRLVTAHSCLPSKPVIDRWKLFAVRLPAAAEGWLLLRLHGPGAVSWKHDSPNELKALHGISWRLQCGNPASFLLRLLLVRHSHRHRHIASRRWWLRLVYCADASAPSNHS